MQNRFAGCLFPPRGCASIVFVAVVAAACALRLPGKAGFIVGETGNGNFTLFQEFLTCDTLFEVSIFDP